MGSELCLPGIVAYLSEFSQDGEMIQNLLDILVTLVNKSNFKGNESMLAKNVTTIFNCKDSIHVLFEQLSSSDMYTKLGVMELLRDCLDVNRVDWWCAALTSSRSWAIASTRVPLPFRS